nr:hypothetical protein GCM10020063_082120 [Dactylosporangium thailandense]
MTLHPALRAELLDDELGVARARLGDRVAGIERRDALICIPLTASDGSTVFLTLDGSGYDAEPFGLSITDPDGSVAALPRWPGQLAHGMHSVLDRPFACIRGCAEYYAFPGHHQDRWDTVRATLRLAELLDHALRKAGCP